MRNLPQKVHLLANVAIIVVAVLLGIVVVKRFILPAYPKSETVEAAKIAPGIKLSLPGVDWAKGERTLLMVLSTNCHYCTDSAPFYQRLAQEKSKHGDIRLVAVLPQNAAEAQKYLNDHGVSVDDVRQAASDATHARATPTLILVDRTGAVVESWVGKLPAEKEAEVMSRFLGERPGS